MLKENKTEHSKGFHTGKTAMLLDYPDVLDVKQLCDVLHISSATAYDILREGSIHSLKIGRAYKIPKQSLIQFLVNSQI